MPVMERPKSRGPLFGGKPMIFIGGPMTRLLREQREKQAKSAPSTEADEDRD
jgi:hypothetical protein